MQAEYRIPIVKGSTRRSLSKRGRWRPAPPAVHESEERYGVQPWVHPQGRSLGGWMWPSGEVKAFSLLEFRRVRPLRATASSFSSFSHCLATSLCRPPFYRASVLAQSCSKSSRNCFAAARSLTITPHLAPLVELDRAQAHAAEKEFLSVAQHRRGRAAADPAFSPRSAPRPSCRPSR